MGIDIVESFINFNCAFSFYRSLDAALIDSVSDSEDFDLFSIDDADDEDRDLFYFSTFTFLRPPSYSACVMPLENWRGFISGRFLSEPCRFSCLLGEADYWISVTLWVLC